MEHNIKPEQIFFFGPEDSSAKDLMGINEQGHLFLPPPERMEHLNLSLGPAGFCPRIEYRGHIFVRSDWITKTFPCTTKDIRRTKDEVTKLFKKFKKSGKFKRCET